MSTPDLNLLNQPADSFVAPPLMPKGTYYGTVNSHEFGKSTKKGTPFVEFTASVTGTGDDIDPEALKGVNLSNKSFRETFYLTPDAMFRLREFLESMGITTQGRTIGEAIPDAHGQAVIMYIDHEQGRKPRADGTLPTLAVLTSMRGA